MIHFLKHEDIKWSFDDSNRPWLRLSTKPYSHTELVDPFPCYSHDEELVKREMDRIISSLKWPVEPDCFVLPFEGLSRTNGSASHNKYHEQPANPYIVLYGKRIPIHPGMTRYLVAHEMGHQVYYALKTILHGDKDESLFDADYAKMRNIEHHKQYGAQHWHLNIKEVIANDIRIVLFNSEPDWWQHPYAHPLDTPAVVEYWNQMKDKHFSHAI